jgi:hypothetical protein
MDEWTLTGFYFFPSAVCCFLSATMIRMTLVRHDKQEGKAAMRKAVKKLNEKK